MRDVERDLAELERLIDDVLTTARLDATGLPAHLATVDRNELLPRWPNARATTRSSPGAVGVEPGPPGS